MKRAQLEPFLVNAICRLHRNEVKQAARLLLDYIDNSQPPDLVPIPRTITDSQIDAIAEAMPGGFAGFLKHWGYRQFARQVLELRTMPSWEPKFDGMELEQERLAMAFCQEIAGPKGKRGSPPDPVRLLEMARALYQAERADAVLLQPGGTPP